jgi:hypothetical protein
MNATRHILAAALAPRTERGALVAAGVVSHPPTPAAAPLDPATELTIAATLYLMRAPDTEAARRRLRAAVDALPMPPLGSLPGALLPFRIAAEMVLRAYRSPVGMRSAEAVLERTRAEYCAEVRASLERELAELEPDQYDESNGSRDDEVQP